MIVHVEKWHHERVLVPRSELEERRPGQVGVLPTAFFKPYVIVPHQILLWGQPRLVVFGLALAIEDGVEQSLASGSPFGREATAGLILEIVHVRSVFGFITQLEFLVQ